MNITVEGISGSAYRVTVGGHVIVVDQPRGAGGEDLGPTPTDLFVAGLASCVAYYAGQFLDRRGVASRDIQVSCDYGLAHSHPARVEWIRIELNLPPGLSEDERAAALRAADHCTVHNSLRLTPDVRVSLHATAPALAGLAS